MSQNRRLTNPTDDDPLLALRGSGKDLWADEHADEYVRRLRESWDEAAERRENLAPPRNVGSEESSK
jgi:hypothetical protein